MDCSGVFVGTSDVFGTNSEAALALGVILKLSAIVCEYTIVLVCASEMVVQLSSAVVEASAVVLPIIAVVSGLVLCIEVCKCMYDDSMILDDWLNKTIELLNASRCSLTSFPLFLPVPNTLPSLNQPINGLGRPDD